ncbi:hypothetical protein [Sessilibacter corallicola]|uniref:Uncharacterized protein n=1 Tax=Sessilibacter corallicola TaxID=2904075 RepID=A0ABQ0AB77_9GAMM
MNVEKINHLEECRYIFKFNNYYAVFYCEEDRGEPSLLKYDTCLITNKDDITVTATSKECWVAALQWRNPIVDRHGNKQGCTYLNVATFIGDPIFSTPKNERPNILFQYIQEEFKEYIADYDTSICPSSASDIILIEHNNIESYWYFSGSSEVNYSLKIRFILDGIGIQLDISNSSVWSLADGDTNKGKKALIDIAKNFLENFEIYDSNTQDCSHLVPGMYPIKPTEKEVINYDLSDGGW